MSVFANLADIYSRGTREKSMRRGTESAREIELTDWSTAANLSNRSSGVQIPRDIWTRFRRYLYSTKCGWIVKNCITKYRFFSTIQYFLLPSVCKFTTLIIPAKMINRTILSLLSGCLFIQLLLSLLSSCHIYSFASWINRCWYYHCSFVSWCLALFGYCNTFLTDRSKKDVKCWWNMFSTNLPCEALWWHMEQSEGKCDCNLSSWAAITKEHFHNYEANFKHWFKLKWSTASKFRLENTKARTFSKQASLLSNEVRWDNDL